MESQWPRQVAALVRDRLGVAPEVEPLGGMSGARVVRLRAGERSAVLKQAATEVEAFVYTELAPLLRDAGVELPELYGAWQEEATWWLLLEEIPQPFPRDRWLADPEQLAVLRRLHGIPAHHLPALPGRYRPGWPQSLTDSALSLFEPGTAAGLRAMLEQARDAASGLFTASCLISGDPNPANWGLRADGSLVLFDWERCASGHPALDLAITVPGSDDRAAFERVANVYAGSPELAPHIAAAKVWVVTEFLAGYARGDVVPSFDIRRLLATFPEWIRAVVNPRQ